LSNPQFFNRRSSFLATVQPTPDLHRRSTVQPRLPTCLQLAPPGLSPALPSNSTSRLSSAVRFFSWLSSLFPARAFNLPCRSTFWPIRRLASPFPPSGPLFGSTCDSRRLLFLQPAFRPASSSRSLAYRPAPLSCRSPACAFNRPSSPAFEPNLRLSSAAASFGFAFVPTLQLAPPVNLPAVLSSQLPACAFRQPFSDCLRTCLRLAPPAVPGSALVPISSLRLQSTFRPTVALISSLRLQSRSPAPLSGLPAACAACQPSSPAFRPNLRLSSNVLFSSWPPIRLQLAPSTNLLCSTFWPDLRLASPTLPSSPPFDQPATRAACQSLAHLLTSLRLAPSFHRTAPLSCCPSSLRLPVNPPALAFEPNLRLSSAVASSGCL